MNPNEIMAQIESSQLGLSDCSEWIEQFNLRENVEFNKLILFLLNDNNISIQQKLLIICFMKQYNIYFLDPNDISSIFHFLDINELKSMTSQLIVSWFNDFASFFGLLMQFAESNPFNFVLLLDTFIEKKEFNEDSFPFIQKAASILNSYAQPASFTKDFHIKTIKCIVSLFNVIENDETNVMIISILFEIFMQYNICKENIPIFFEIMRLRFDIEKHNSIPFYQKVQHISDFIAQSGPQNGMIECSLLYYLSQIILNIFTKEDFSTILVFPPERLVWILILFSVYDEKQIDNWLSDTEDFFHKNEEYLIPKGINFNNDKTDSDYDDDEINENYLYKDSYELHQFIYEELIRLGNIQINETMNFLILVINIFLSLIGAQIPNYSTPLINLNVILFFMNIEPVIEFDGSKYSETSNEVSAIYFILYCSKKGILLEDISNKIEYFLSQKPEMYKIVVASILIYYNSEAINPVLYSECFVQCLSALSSFNTEDVTGIMKLLTLLADFENKPFIVPGFVEKMEGILEVFIKTLVLYQNAYKSTASLCNLIAHFIRYIPFQKSLLPFFFDFINHLFTSPLYASLGIKLENAILNCKSSCSLFTDDQIQTFHGIFLQHLGYLNIPYLIENSSIIPSILSISYFFTRHSLIKDIDEWIFPVFSCPEISSRSFDKIPQIIISLFKRDESVHRFEYLKILIDRSELLSEGNDENPLLSSSIISLAYLVLYNKEQFQFAMNEFGYGIEAVLNAIYRKAFKNNNEIVDARLILGCLFVYGDFQIFLFEQNQKLPLKVLIQFIAVTFFNKVVDMVINNKLNELRKSSVIDKNDVIFDNKFMSCSFADLINLLIFEPFNSGIEESKNNFLQILNENHL